MAQQDIGPCWDSLPSVIMLEIFIYLPQEDRFRASLVCKNWRQALFHPSFWKDISFIFEHPDRLSFARNLVEYFALSVRQATVRVFTPIYSCELDNLLKHLRGNRNLKRLILEPTSSSLEWQNATCDGDELEIFEGWIHPIFESIKKIIETSRQLEVLTLGCLEDLTVRSGNVLSALCDAQHEKHLKHLGLASVKDDPEGYECAIIDPLTLSSFNRLNVLTLDYDNMSDEMLNALSYGQLRRLVIHVHHWDENLVGTSNLAWQSFVQKNRHCTLRLSLLHAYSAINVLDTEILRPAMPLTHFKALFCESVNVKALLWMSNWYSKTLTSIVWIDSMCPNEKLPPTLDVAAPDSPDPLVLIAWRCKHFSELLYIGHKYYQENILAIARLRGKRLTKFEFANSDIVCDNDSPYEYKSIRKELTSIFGYEWEPFADEDLPTVIINAVEADSRDVIMPLVLQDAK